MKNNIKNYILLLLHFFFICYFIYNNKDIGNESYTKLLSFLSFSLDSRSTIIFSIDVLYSSISSIYLNPKV